MSIIPKNNRDPKPRCFASLVQIWWSLLEWAMSYRADKLVIDIHTRTQRPTDAGDDNTRRPKLASGNEVKFDFQVKFDLVVQGRSLPKIIGIFTKVFCTYVSNLVILAWTADELSCGQASDWYTQTHTHTLTDTQRGAMTIPGGQNWPRVKMEINAWNFYCDVNLI